MRELPPGSADADFPADDIDAMIDQHANVVAAAKAIDALGHTHSCNRHTQVLDVPVAAMIASVPRP